MKRIFTFNELFLFNFIENYFYNFFNVFLDNKQKVYKVFKNEEENKFVFEFENYKNEKTIFQLYFLNEEKFVNENFKIKEGDFFIKPLKQIENTEYFSIFDLSFYLNQILKIYQKEQSFK